MQFSNKFFVFANISPPRIMPPAARLHMFAELQPEFWTRIRFSKKLGYCSFFFHKGSNSHPVGPENPDKKMKKVRIYKKKINKFFV